MVFGKQYLFFKKKKEKHTQNTSQKSINEKDFVGHSELPVMSPEAYLSQL